MDSKIMGKNLIEYWNVISLPVYVSIALSVLSVLLMLAGAGTIVLTGALRLVGFAVWLWAGWRAVKEFKYGLEHSAVAGAVGGVVSGLIGAVISLASFFAFGATALAAAGPYGAAVGTVTAGAMVTSLIISPIFGAVFGAIFAAAGAFIAKSMK